MRNGCSWSGRGSVTPGSSRTARRTRRLRRCASGSTGCRRRSGSPLRGSASCRPPRACPVSERGPARIGLMSPGEILSDLEARRAARGGGSRLSAARHRTVRAAVEWSYELLEPAEQAAFRSLAVFVGGFDAEAAMAVAPGLTVDLFARLVDKSVVATGKTSRGRTRYRLLETVREYAHELLVASGELEPARERHLRYLSVVTEDADLSWPQFVTEPLLDELRQDYENVRAALEWAADADPCAGLRLLAATRELFHNLGHADGRRIAQLLLERCPACDRARVEVLITAGILAMVTANA